MSKKIPTVKYSQIRRQLRTFDVLTCIPRGWFMGWIEHTAGVYVCHETGQVMVYQSTTQKYAGKSGVTLTPMAEFVKKYPGQIRLRQCHIKGRGRRGKGQQEAAEHIRLFRGTPYPNLKSRSGRWFVANARIDLPFATRWANKDTHSVFFCAHLIADWFRDCWLTKRLNAAEVDTKDFRAGGSFEKKLEQGITLGPEIQIVKG